MGTSWKSSLIVVGWLVFFFAIVSPLGWQGVAEAGGEKEFKLQGDCYPNNNTLLNAGSTEAEGTVRAKVEEIELEDETGDSPLITDLGGATLILRFAAEIKEYKMRGRLTATIHY